VPINTVAKTVEKLFAKYPTFGGVADWEYFNTLPGGVNNPVKWRGYGKGDGRLASDPIARLRRRHFLMVSR
jgi:hypothetical protein